MEDKVGLTLACLNIKKLVKMMTGKTYNFTQISQYYWIIGELGKNIKKTNIKNDVCLHSERSQDFSWLLFNVSLFHYRGLEKESPVLDMLGFLQQSGYCLR